MFYMDIKTILILSAYQELIRIHNSTVIKTGATTKTH